MNLPGDWHVGLNMVQAIFNVVYVGFLDSFQSLLGWIKINKDVSSCYFQATRLVTFVFVECVRFFSHKFVSSRAATPSELAMNDSDYIVTVALSFSKYLKILKASNDKWIATCGVFIELAHDFLAFVEAYRIGDAVCIEYEY